MHAYRVNVQKCSGMMHLFSLMVLDVVMLMPLSLLQNLLPYDLGERILSFQGRTGQKGTQGSPSSRGSRVSISVDIYCPSLSPEDATEASRVCAPAVN